MPFQKSFFGVIILCSVLCFSPGELQAQLKYNNGFTISTGIYSASGFGTNPYAAFRYNYYLSKGRHFVESSFGISSIDSDVLKSVANARLFESTRLLIYQFVYGYDPKMWTSFPYMTVGVAGINQGGQSKFALVAGLGNRLYFDTIFGSSKIGLRYDLRDQIIRQRFNDKSSFFAHNLVFTINLEFFY